MKKFLILLSFIYVGAISASFAQNVTENSISLKDQGIFFYKNGKFLEALNCFERLDRVSLNADVLLLMSNCYSSLNNDKKASELLIKAIEFNPDSPFSYYNLGLLHYQNNNVHTAIANFNKAVSINKNFTAAYYNLGVCYYLINNFKKAKDNFIIALGLNPENPDIYYNLVLTYTALKNKTMARKYLNIYSKISAKIPCKDINKSNTLISKKKHVLKKKHYIRKSHKV